ncbi:MAG: carboxypeptidase regulatory-like domain-containing protein, partial [Anaerolineae bacterium]|nr:carboxypeptidase regulatory-like domain-containing protein [Anaerolineae bacterium]
AINVGETSLVTVSLNNVPVEGYTSAEFTCTYNANLFEVSDITIANLFGADPATAISGPQAQSLIVAIAGSNGNKATTSGPAFTFNVTGLQVGQTVIECRARVSQGNNVLTEIPFAVDYITILGSTPTPNLTPSHTPTSTQTPEPVTPTATDTSTPDFPPPPPASQTATPTIPMDWLTYTNSYYGFQFRYPPRLEDLPSQDNNYARIDLPFVQGTNLGEKYLQVDVVENANPCRSPVAASSFVQSSETVMLNGITFLKETGQEPAAGNLYQFVAYSTARDNACVSLSFVLHSVNPGNIATPIPVFDYAAESAVFEQIVTTYTWLTIPSTATPTPTVSTPVESPTSTATQTSTPIESPTATLPPSTSGTLTGQVLASESVTVSLYDASNALVTSVTANVDGTFSLTAPAATYTVRSTASGFLSAEGSVTLTGGSTTTMPTVTLLAGDIDNNNVINQFDALTIGMNYNASAPSAADLNNDGIINVLDLELLAQN